MAIRPTKCPLCGTRVLKSHLQRSGVCIKCDEGRASSKQAVQEAAEASRTLQEQQARSHYLKLQNGAEARLRAREEEERQKALDAEHKQMLALHKEQASIALARRSLLHYIERRLPNYEADWVHELIAMEIERFIRDVEDGKAPRLILACPSRLGKSELASISAPAFMLGLHPEWEVIIASYSDVLPTKFSRQIREQLLSEEYRAVFPHGAVLKKDDASAKAWSTEQGGGVRATGIGSGLRGHGANVLIMDDVVENEYAANSQSAMEEVWTFASSTALSRLMPKSGILVIAQRLGPEDLIGRYIRKMKNEYDEHARMLKEASSYEDEGNIEEATKIRFDADELWKSMDHWRVVKYPALAVGDEYLTPEGDIIRASEHPYIDPSWRLLRKNGESIHPKRFSRYYYLNQKRANPVSFSSTFQQEPISEEGSYFTLSDFSRRYVPGKHPKLELCAVFCAWDLAISTATTADYTVGIAGAMDHHGDLYLLELVKGRFGDAFMISDLIIDLHKRWKAQITGIEKMMVSMTLGPVLARRMQERKEYIVLAEGKEELRTGNQDKKLRARQFQALCRQGKVVVPQTDQWDEYIAHMTQFGASRHDDEVDASAWLGILATRQPPPRNPALAHTPEGKHFVSWYDEMLAEMGGQSGSYMEA